MDNQESILRTLQRIPWFVDLTPGQLEALALISTIREVDADVILFNEGGTDACLFILLEGGIASEAHVPGHGIARLYNSDPLDVVGWSVLTPVARQRTATARAVVNSRLLCINSQLLKQMCEEDHDLGFIVMKRIANVVASRLLSTRLQLFDMLRQDDEHAPVNELK